MVAGVTVARMPHTFSFVPCCFLASGRTRGLAHLLWRVPDRWGYDRLLTQCGCSACPAKHTHQLMKLKVKSPTDKWDTLNFTTSATLHNHWCLSIIVLRSRKAKITIGIGIWKFVNDLVGRLAVLLIGIAGQDGHVNSIPRLCKTFQLPCTLKTNHWHLSTLPD